VHQNGPIEIRAGSRCLIYREILFLSFSSSLREIVTHRFDVDSPRFRAESSFGRSTGKLRKKKEQEEKRERTEREREREREREKEILAVESRARYSTTAVLTNVIVRDARLNLRRSFRLKLIERFGVIVIIIANRPTGTIAIMQRNAVSPRRD